MPNIYYYKAKDRWRVRWNTETRDKVSRHFLSKAEAEAFAATITDERPPRTHTGPMATVWLSAENIRQNIKSRTVIDENGCWIWQASGGSTGYASASHRVGGRIVTEVMHRVSYKVFVGPIPDGLQIDHLCMVRKCVNPEHLEPVTAAENMRRMFAAKKLVSA